MYHRENIDTEEQAHAPRYALFAAIWGVATVSVLIAAKGFAYWQSGSAAILATLVDSVTDAAISIMMLFALSLSLKPADHDHRHGHGKAEGLAALFHAAIMAGAGMFLGIESLHRFLSPQIPQDHLLGIGISGLAIILSLILIGVQTYALKRAPSLIIESDRANFTTDIFMNGSVIAALLLHLNGAPHWIDPAVALAVSVYFGITASRIAKNGADMLMDKELPDAVRNRILKTAKQHDGVLGIHDLRTRRSGMALHISFDIEIDPDISLREAHDISRRLELEILKDYPHAEIMIHKDPYGDTYDPRHRVQGVHH